MTGFLPAQAGRADPKGHVPERHGHVSKRPGGGAAAATLEGVLQRRLLTLCFATSVASVALVVAYRIATGSGDLNFLLWNLALAWIPFVAALAMDDVRSTPLSLQLPLLALWLVFFPNAPYLVTDIVHIDPTDHTFTGILGDIAIVSVAPAGLALGFSSLALVERAVRERFGGRLALAISIVSLVVASLGIYLGRVVRLNSWDLLSRPRVVGRVLHQLVLDPLAHPFAAFGTVALAATLAWLYLRFRRTAGVVPEHARRNGFRTSP